MARQIQSKRTEFVCPSIQSKRTEFVCPSSIRPLSAGSDGARRPDRFSQKEQNLSVRRRSVSCSLARNGARRPDRFSQKEQNSSVRRQPVRCCWLGTALDGQTDSVKKNRIRLSVVQHLSPKSARRCTKRHRIAAAGGSGSSQYRSSYALTLIAQANSSSQPRSSFLHPTALSSFQRWRSAASYPSLTSRVNSLPTGSLHFGGGSRRHSLH